jgi:hypothetical protein
MGEDREYRFARGALQPPNGEPPETNTGVMGVARQAPAAMTGRLVFQLKAKREEAGEHELEKRLAITQQLKVGGFVLEINGDRPIFSALAGVFGHGSPLRHGVCAVYDTPGG